MTKSARNSAYRNPERLERAVLNLDRVAPFVDSPMLLHRAPELLEYPTEEIVRRLVRMKFLFAAVDVGYVEDVKGNEDARFGNAGVVATSELLGAKALVIPTNEEWVIAQQSVELL